MVVYSIMNYYEYNLVYGILEEVGFVIFIYSYYKWIFIYEVFNVVLFVSEVSLYISWLILLIIIIRKYESYCLVLC